MKILHITPHLGGGVGKAHAAICGALPRCVEQMFLLLEEPRDRRYVDTITSRGACVRVAHDLDEVRTLTASTDIVQFEFWNHPRLLECLARTDFPVLRTVFWSHVSGLFKPLIAPGLMAEAGRFVFTTEASRVLPSVTALPPDKVAVINSGFGFADVLPPARDRAPRIAYLGTVDFTKMHPGFFEAIDALACDVEIAIWGDYDLFGRVVAQALSMSNPQRVQFRGHTAQPAQALSNADIFFYPLQPTHYGTAENALVEAMSLGLVPVVLNNPAEATIVRHGETGLVARSIAECADLLQQLLDSPELRQRLSRNAIRAIAETRTPTRAARDFVALWLALAAEAPRRPDFRRAVGDTPADWFLATQNSDGGAWTPSIVPDPQPSKGTLEHFESVFAGDASLKALRAGARSARLTDHMARDFRQPSLEADIALNKTANIQSCKTHTMEKC